MHGNATSKLEKRQWQRRKQENKKGTGLISKTETVRAAQLLADFFAIISWLLLCQTWLEWQCDLALIFKMVISSTVIVMTSITLFSLNFPNITFCDFRDNFEKNRRIWYS